MIGEKWVAARGLLGTDGRSILVASASLAGAFAGSGADDFPLLNHHVEELLTVHSAAKLMNLNMAMYFIVFKSNPKKSAVKTS